MRLRIQVGAAMLDWSGVDVTPRTVEKLIDQLAEKNAVIEPDAEDTEPEKPPIGFGVTTERADEMPLETFDR